MKTSFLTIVSVLAGIAASTSAFATGENTVTSKAYVDAMDATKQNTIPEAETNYNTPGVSVVTYTDTAGEIGERWICDANLNGDGDCVDNNLVTKDLVDSQVSGINNSITNVNNSITNITNQMNAQTLESINVQLPLTCANSCEGLSGKELSACEAAAGAAGGCTLWEIGSVGVAHKLYSCTAQTVATDCPSCGTGTVKACENDICTCNACKGYNISANSASQCCSGYLQNGQNKCGCSTNADCETWAAQNNTSTTCTAGTSFGCWNHTCGCSGGPK